MHQGKILKEVLEQKYGDLKDAVDDFGKSIASIYNYSKQEIIPDYLIDKAVEITGCSKNIFFEDPYDNLKKEYDELLKKYVRLLENERELEATLKKCQEEEKIYEPGTIEHTLSVYRKSAKIADQRINTLEEENEEFRSELIELRTKIRKYEKR